MNNKRLLVRFLLASLVCMIVIGVLTTPLLPRITNSLALVYQGQFPDWLPYRHRSYASNNSDRCFQPKEIKEKLIEVGKVYTFPNITQTYPIFIESKQQSWQTVFSLYVKKSSDCYLYYGLEGGP